MVDASIVNLAELGVLVVGVVIALFQLRGIKETRQAELFSVLMERLDSPEFWNSYRTIRRTLSEKSYEEWLEFMQNDPAYGEVIGIQTFFCHVGWLVKKGLIDREMVRENMFIAVVSVFETLNPYFEEFQKRSGRPRNPYFKYLYDLVKDRFYQTPSDFET